VSGSVVHFEIPADRVDRAREFYREAFGWTITPFGGEDYTMLGTAASDDQGRPTQPGAINGGLVRRSNEVSAPVVTVAVDDIDQALEKISALGGQTLIGRTAVPDMGFTAYFMDSEGNVIGLWQSA
jgi:predicted enzyme related to lactoylglutathione lyase